MQITDTILGTIKPMLQVPPHVDVYDSVIMTYINDSLMTLYQLGLPDGKPFYLETGEETWEDYLGPDIKFAQAVKSAIYTDVKILFDPPTMGALINSLKEVSAELKFRLVAQASEIRRRKEEL